MAQTKISTRRGFKVLGAAAGAAFTLVVAAGCNEPAPAPEQQQEQQDGDDQQGGDQQDGDDQQGGEQDDD
ncbi:hypothetical protein SAMN05216215_104355 [Saccharopolyspora shandongensis]|uniref:Uncharacterized protein n=1 Tax=Saccharopolyspora shandongensis TaxID=418495 RepID=A0A1H3PR83_9PSEU|nr:hypothetical protein [Saccharopolyspora shandongensis]SDZ03471.1 hypothetical protein SAMN05216215_104355 [Saccharopolyspora shandongensis]